MYRKSKGYWNYWQYVIFGRLPIVHSTLYSKFINQGNNTYNNSNNKKDFSFHHIVYTSLKIFQ